MNPPPTPDHSQSPRPALLLPTPKPPLHRRGWVWIVVLIVVIAGSYLFLRKPPSNPDQAAGGQQDKGSSGGKRGAAGAGRSRPNAPVVVATARTGDMNVYLYGLGTAVPLNTVTVRSRVEGQLLKILFKEGENVKAGQTLAEIDPRAFQVQLTQAQGQIARDQALLTNAEVDLKRYQLLFQQDSIAKQQLDTQQALVRQYQGALKADQGVVDNAKLQLSYAHITAPISGRLGLRQVDTGNIVRASDPNGLVVITQLQPITVLFSTPEDNIPAIMKKLRAGDKPAVDAYDRTRTTQLANGTLLSVDNQIDPTTGTVKLKAQFANDDYSLFPNQFINARMLVDVRRGVTIIPTAGVQRGTQGPFVYVLQPDQSVLQRTIKVGYVQGEDSEIQSGLQEGDVVVTDGADKLRDGAKVVVAMKDGAAVTPDRHSEPERSNESGKSVRRGHGEKSRDAQGINRPGGQPQTSGP
jgi:multidrug efflux system membrane fusion protein